MDGDWIDYKVPFSFSALRTGWLAGINGMGIGWYGNKKKTSNGLD